MRRILLAIAVWGVLASAAAGEERFPPPDFTSGYQLPSPEQPPPPPAWQNVLDVGVLVVALGLASWVVLSGRRRIGMVLIMLFAIGYFGFWRQGCVCPIGAIQNVAQGIFDAGLLVPLAVLAFLLLPIVATLLWGRTFCGGVCPLGAIQDVLVWRPIRVPSWVEHGLGLVAWVYLGLAVLLAVTDCGYVICRYDPFVALFRLGGPWRMVLLGVGVLALGAFVARPYCRFLCPLGAIFRPCSRVAAWHAKITPAECIRCRLCEDSCPFGAIRSPSADAPRTRGKATLALMLLAVPALVAAGGLAASWLAEPMARMNYTVNLSDLLGRQQTLAEVRAAAAPLPIKAGAQTFELDGRQVLCRSAETGQTLWSLDLPALADPNGEVLALVDPNAVWLLSANGTTRPQLACVDRASGGVLWRSAVPDDAVNAGYAFRNGPEFRSAGAAETDVLARLHARAADVRDRMYWGLWILGAFLGAVVAAKLVDLSIRRRRDGYAPDPGKCLSCGRCFEHCPIEQQRRLGRRPSVRGKSEDTCDAP